MHNVGEIYASHTTLLTIYLHVSSLQKQHISLQLTNCFISHSTQPYKTITSFLLMYGDQTEFFLQNCVMSYGTSLWNRPVPLDPCMQRSHLYVKPPCKCHAQKAIFATCSGTRGYSVAVTGSTWHHGVYVAYTYTINIAPFYSLWHGMAPVA